MPRQPSGGVARGTASPCCVDARHSFAVGLELEARAGHVPRFVRARLSPTRPSLYRAGRAASRTAGASSWPRRGNQGGTMKLFTIGDSISQGFMSAGAAKPQFSYSTLLAKAMGEPAYA